MKEGEPGKNSKTKALFELCVAFAFIILTAGTLGVVISVATEKIFGLSLNTVISTPALWTAEVINFIKLNLFYNHLFSFLLPSLFFVIFFKKEPFLSFFDLDRNIKFSVLGLSILVFMASLPVVYFSFFLNQMIELPEFLSPMESGTEELMKAILSERTVFALFTNLILIGVVPAIGEELVFRGILQNKLIAISGNKWVGVTLAAIVFSIIHFQFEGFLPRVILGFILGAIYVLTNNLWYPVLIHFFNNGMQVVLAYFSPETVEAADHLVAIPWQSAILSFLLTVILLMQYKRIESKT